MSLLFRSELVHMTKDHRNIRMPSIDDLDRWFQRKYASSGMGWAPRRRHRFGYYLPADIYETCLEKEIFNGCSWIDVGGGQSIFPENLALGRCLASRCSVLVAVDP